MNSIFIYVTSCPKWHKSYFQRKCFIFAHFKSVQIAGNDSKAGVGGFDYLRLVWRVGLWGCHKDCFEGRVWIIGLDCGVPIKTNQGSGVTFGTCLLQRSLALYPESPICIYNIISRLSWRQKLVLSQKQVFSWSCKIRWEMSEKVQQQRQGCKIWRRKHIMMSKSTFRKILGPSPSCWRGAAN